MKKTLVLLVVLLLIALGAILCLHRAAGPAATPPNESVRAEPAPNVPPPPPFVAPPRPVLETVPAAQGGEPEQVIHVYPEQVLATVNGTAITLKDLAGIARMKNDKEQVLSHHLYESLLSRAVDRELVFQAARTQGIKLSEDQEKQLSAMRAREEQQSPGVVDLTMSPERLELDQRDAESRMLLVNLAAQAGAPSQFVTPEQVQAYYEAHKSELGELPSDPAEAQGARNKIDLQIRQKLAGETMNTYQAAVDGLLNQIRTSASVHVTSPDAH